MSNRLKFIAVGLLGVMLSCTLVTARAADYRKETKDYTLKPATSVAAFTFHAPAYDLLNFVLPENQVVFSNKVQYLSAGNDPKPENTRINGLINDRREQERICTGLNL
jgi:hypothetical protein